MLKLCGITQARARLWREKAELLSDEDIDAFVEWQGERVRCAGTGSAPRLSAIAVLTDQSRRPWWRWFS